MSRERLRTVTTLLWRLMRLPVVLHRVPLHREELWRRVRLLPLVHREEPLRREAMDREARGLRGQTFREARLVRCLSGSRWVRLMAAALG